MPGKTAKRQTESELREFQRLAFAAFSWPLADDFSTQAKFRDGQPMAEVAASFIKPNDRLTSFERLAIYNRSYWVRLLDCLWDDYPGLRAILGHRKFEKLRIAYLNQYPSRSYTLRNLGDRLVQFMQEQPQLIAPRQAICLDMAKFEWAQIVAFDGPARPAVSVDYLLGKDPANLRLGLQPYLMLLDMGYPLDEFILAVKKRNRVRSEASNAMQEEAEDIQTRPAKLPRAKRVFVAVHRHDNDLYYRRLEPAEYRILTALQEGMTVAEACITAIEEHGQADIAWSARIQKWFEAFAGMGWFCRPR